MSAQSVVDTNKSIQLLNTKTDTFYQKQKRYNNILILLTFAIFSTAAVSAVVSTCDYLKPNNSDKYIDTTTRNQRLQLIETTLQNKIFADSVFHQRIKDSLRIP